jgi:transcription initiation factor IIE alpha subunit
MPAEVTLADADPTAKLAHALERDLDMRSTDAREVADLVLGAFDGEEELDDENLSTDLRSMFYTLEEEKLLDFRREETRNEDGHIRRYFHWTIRWDEVAPETGDDEGDAEGEDSVYDDLPQNAWDRSG